MSEQYPTPAGIRICVIGDGLVCGLGDPKAQGWTGRVAARTPAAASAISLFPLGVPDEPTSGMLDRWRAECSLRWHTDAENRLVIALGRADVYSGVNTARSRLNLANMLDAAANLGVPALVVGPPPVSDSATQRAVADLASAFADVCDRRDVQYVDCYAPLAAHDMWHADLAASDGYHPGQSGYGLMAWLVLHNGWYSWLGTAPPE